MYMLHTSAHKHLCLYIYSLPFLTQKPFDQHNYGDASHISVILVVQSRVMDDTFSEFVELFFKRIFGPLAEELFLQIEEVSPKVRYEPFHLCIKFIEILWVSARVCHCLQNFQCDSYSLSLLF